MLRAILILAILAGSTAGNALAEGTAQRRDGARLPPPRSWGYQLQKVDPEAVARSPFDLVVIDYSRSGDGEGRFTPEEIRSMQLMPGGGRRIVLAYLSIGEAESYRDYWKEEWVEPMKTVARADTEEAARGKAGAKVRTLHVPRLTAPTWLGRENEAWRGNYLVRYWDKSWQGLIFGSPGAYLDRILAAGFDGVYLDRVDAFYGVAELRPSARQEMVRFVIELARYARRTKPAFAVVPQNGEELLLDQGYLAEIDGVAKEDLLYGHPSEGQRNSPGVISTSVSWLTPAIERGLPVLVVEYLPSREADKVRLEIEGRGMRPYIGVRSLDRLVLPGAANGERPRP